METVGLFGGFDVETGGEGAFAKGAKLFIF
jgi:hypothetical protein